MDDWPVYAENAGCLRRFNIAIFLFFLYIFFSRQTLAGAAKSIILSRQTFRRGKHTFVCRDRTFLATKMILMAASANDSLVSANTKEDFVCWV